MEKNFLKSYVTSKCEVTAHVFSTTQNTDQLNTHQLGHVTLSQNSFWWINYILRTWPNRWCHLSSFVKNCLWSKFQLPTLSGSWDSRWKRDAHQAKRVYVRKVMKFSSLLQVSFDLSSNLLQNPNFVIEKSISSVSV